MSIRRPFLTAFLLIATASALLGETVRLSTTRDTWFCNVGDEADGNNGGAARLKVKSTQEMSLLDVDVAPLRGRVVSSARLFVRSPGEPRLQRVTVSSFAAEWFEGSGRNYEPQPGASTHNHRRHPEVPWTIPGGDLCSVILGQGGTVWRSVDATAPDADGWQTIAVDPLLVAWRIAEISQGFFLYDDTGSVWSRDGEQFTYTLMPNRYVYSRDQNAASAPYLVVELGPDDRLAPRTVGAITSEVGDLPAGEAKLAWSTPEDQGPAGVVGFRIEAAGRPVPRYLVPRAGASGQRVVMQLRDLDLAPGATVPIVVRAVDGAGNVGPAAEALVAVSDRLPMSLPGKRPEPFQGVATLPRLGAAEVAVVDELDKVQPATGRFMPPQPDNYRAANHLWSAARKTIRLFAAKNEITAFQVLIQQQDDGSGRPPGAPAVVPALTFPDAPISVSFGRYQPVPSADGPMPDPIVPWETAVEDANQSESLLVELHVPHHAPPGRHHGALTLTQGAETLTLDVDLTVWDFTLPDHLSFLPDMNCYGLPANERDYYRLAHAHRTVLNRVPYSQRGEVADGLAPVWDGQSLDWTAWDERFGPLFDGSAFADLPRRGVPIENFYLPIHENWPLTMKEHYNGSYWADQAFPPSYRTALVEVSRQFADHVRAKGWDETFFQFFLNNKVDFKRNGWSRGSSPWLLDEPSNWQDFEALRWFGAAFHEGVARARPGPATLLFRCDISRPQWQREVFDELLDYYVVGGAFRTYRRMVLDRKAAFGPIVVEYGSANAIEAANTHAVAWSLDVWGLGGDGVLPWQTVGTAESWRKADVLSLFYPGRDGSGPLPSIRLKAYRRGQQDVEYLTILAQTAGQPRWSVGRAVRDGLNLTGRRAGTGASGEDAGRIDYGQLSPQDLWALRVQVGEHLSKQRPEPMRRRVDLRPPPRIVASGAGGESRP